MPEISRSVEAGNHIADEQADRFNNGLGCQICKGRASSRRRGRDAFAPFLLAACRADPSLIQRDAIRATAGDTDQEMADLAEDGV
jgi:hypothetical protein